jgi:hypothetical protein
MEIKPPKSRTNLYFDELRKGFPREFIDLNRKIRQGDEDITTVRQDRLWIDILSRKPKIDKNPVVFDGVLLYEWIRTARSRYSSWRLQIERKFADFERKSAKYFLEHLEEDPIPDFTSLWEKLTHQVVIDEPKDEIVKKMKIIEMSIQPQNFAVFGQKRQIVSKIMLCKDLIHRFSPLFEHIFSQKVKTWQRLGNEIGLLKTWNKWSKLKDQNILEYLFGNSGADLILYEKLKKWISQCQHYKTVIVLKCIQLLCQDSIERKEYTLKISFPLFVHTIKKDPIQRRLLLSYLDKIPMDNYHHFVFKIIKNAFIF